MPQRHLDRLTPVDASFLHQEGPVSHMHIGGVTIVEGAAADHGGVPRTDPPRLHLVPRYRHKLAYTAIDSGRPVWIDDPSFNLEYHVRHTALPAPGKWEQLQEPDRADLLPAARPLQAPVGDVADRGPRGEPLRADHQDPPLA
jgi:diacylglycerol O-acyltransferase